MFNFGLFSSEQYYENIISEWEALYKKQEKRANKNLMNACAKEHQLEELFLELLILARDNKQVAAKQLIERHFPDRVDWI